jgi:selenocysteine lyase/cysteine desulfurase
VLDEAHAAIANLLNCAPQEVVFGQNMTTLTFHLSRSIAKWINAGDEIIVTRLDHDANIAPWLLLAEDRGAVIRWVDVNEEDVTLRLADFETFLNPKTKLVAVGYASNSVGAINDVQRITELAHAAGALVFVDAVQFAPHGLIDVRALDGKRELLERLPAYKVRPATDELPGKWETGTQNHEGQAGVLGAIEYFEWLGDTAWGENVKLPRRTAIEKAMEWMVGYEQELCAHLINGLQSVNGLRIRGITDPARFGWRVPTVSFTLEGWHPRKVAEQLAEENIYVWDGNYYALAIAERLGVQAAGGMVRAGLAHYNTREEIERLVTVLAGLRAGLRG